MLLRRTQGSESLTDEMFHHGKWKPDDSFHILRWMVGKDDLVDAVTEAEARKLEPDAFES